MQGRSNPRARLENPEWVLEVPRPADIPALSDLCGRIVRETGTAVDRFPSSTIWRSLIDSEDIVCAKSSDGRVAGFYATNHYALTYNPDDLPPVRGAFNTLCNRFKLPETNVAFGAQFVLDPERQNSDLRPQLFRTLLRTVGYRYRHLFTVIRKDDALNLQRLPHEGWRIFHEEDDICYLTIDVARALRLVTSTLVLRIPERNDHLKRAARA